MTLLPPGAKVHLALGYTDNLTHRSRCQAGQSPHKAEALGC
jgi:hypothetical protein